MLTVNEEVWMNADFSTKATKLRDEIRQGIEKFGTVDLGEYVSEVSRSIATCCTSFARAHQLSAPSLVRV